MGKICDPAEAVAGIRDRAAVASTGVLGWLTPDVVLGALADRYSATGSPRELTFYFPCATGDAMDIPGMDRVARPGLMRRIVAGSYINPRHPRTGARPALTGLIQNDLIEAYSWPIGVAMHWLREVARRGPGYLTRVGLGTYVDPRNGGGKLTTLAVDDLVELVDLRGEEYLFFPSWPLDVGILRASSADEAGNLSFEDQPLVSGAIALALAVKASGGRVIAQVSRIVPHRSRPAHSVRIPGVLVDHVVVAPGQPVGTDIWDARGYLEPVANPVAGLPWLAPGADKVIARRVAREVQSGETTIFGFGGSSDVVQVMAEDGVFADGTFGDYVFTTEHGPFGGAVMSGWQFSANYSPDALLDGAYQFDFIDGGGCDLAVLAFAQLDQDACVNVTRFGAANPGSGGFMHIAANTNRLVFAGTLTTNGLSVRADDGRLTIVHEGAVRKLVPQVDHVTYRIGAGVRRGQRATVISERAVFEVTGDGLVLTEVAPGIDVRRDVFDQIGFVVPCAGTVKTMDSALFQP